MPSLQHEDITILIYLPDPIPNNFDAYLKNLEVHAQVVCAQLIDSPQSEHIPILSTMTNK